MCGPQPLVVMTRLFTHPLCWLMRSVLTCCDTWCHVMACTDLTVTYKIVWDPRLSSMCWQLVVSFHGFGLGVRHS